jgi:hypothetical protein
MAFVIPAEAGIQGFQLNADALDSRLRGNDWESGGNDGEVGMTEVRT